MKLAQIVEALTVTRDRQSTALAILDPETGMQYGDITIQDGPQLHLYDEYNTATDTTRQEILLKLADALAQHRLTTITIDPTLSDTPEFQELVYDKIFLPAGADRWTLNAPIQPNPAYPYLALRYYQLYRQPVPPALTQIITGHHENLLLQPFRAWSSTPPPGAQGSPDKPNSPSNIATAIHYHAREFQGRRWPALEHAIQQRANTYQAIGGNYLRPRLALFNYLNNIQEPWPEGDRLAWGFLQHVLDKANQRIRKHYQRHETDSGPRVQPITMHDFQILFRYLSGHDVNMRRWNQTHPPEVSNTIQAIGFRFLPSDVKSIIYMKPVIQYFQRQFQN